MQPEKQFVNMHKERGRAMKDAMLASKISL